MVDIGGGTTDIAVFTAGSIRHTGVIPIAGDQVTNDIAMALRTPAQHAEKLKIQYACALAQLANADETIKVPSVGDRPPRDLSRQALAEVVEPRYDELFTLIQTELRRSGFEDLIPSGIVLTGGTAKMEGVVELAEEIFHMPVRLAMPQGVRGMDDILQNPIFSTGMGLLHYAAQGGQANSSATTAHVPKMNDDRLTNLKADTPSEKRTEKERKVKPVNEGPGLLSRCKDWLKGNF
ncbi:cell division protein FtsA, partial [Neptunomonas phycophila]